VGVEKVYTDLRFPFENSPPHRPYIVMNMVATIDGKIVSGERGEPVHDLGSKNDHILMRRIQSAADAVLIGASSQRSSANIHYASKLIRIVATKSGEIHYESRFFIDAPKMAWILCTENTNIREGFQALRCGQESIDWKCALRKIKSELNVKTLLVEGGANLNAQILEMDCVDEMFLTIAQKVKLGENTPTYAGGVPLARESLLTFRLVELHRVDDEVFLRYRRASESFTVQ
jgi:riboflavin biosynthesis pyrimidine reductase